MLMQIIELGQTRQQIANILEDNPELNEAAKNEMKTENKAKGLQALLEKDCSKEEDNETPCIEEIETDQEILD